MGINERLSIKLVAKSESGEAKAFPMQASDFFEYEEYDESDWDAWLPWRRLELPDYLNTEADKFNAILWEVTDNVSQTRRRILFQRFANGQVSFCWNDISKDPLGFEAIFNSEREDSVVHIVRVSVTDTETRVTVNELLKEDG